MQNHCPDCGASSFWTQDVQLHEMDTEGLRMMPPKNLAEIRCLGCGWMGASSSDSEKPIL